MEILAYIPGAGLFVHVAEGTGDNLLDDDIEEGYVDYYMWTTYEAVAYGSPEFKELDGGQVMLESMCVDAFDDAEVMLRDCITEWLELPEDTMYIVVELHQ